MKKILTWPRLALALAVACIAVGVAAGSVSGSSGQAGEKYNAKPALLTKAFGTTKGI